MPGKILQGLEYWLFIHAYYTNLCLYVLVCVSFFERSLGILAKDIQGSSHYYTKKYMPSFILSTQWIINFLGKYVKWFWNKLFTGNDDALLELFSLTEN